MDLLANAEFNKHRFLDDMGPGFDRDDSMAGRDCLDWVFQAKLDGKYIPAAKPTDVAAYRVVEHISRPIFFKDVEIELTSGQFKNHFATVIGQRPDGHELHFRLDDSAVGATGKISNAGVIERQYALVSDILAAHPGIIA